MMLKGLLKGADTPWWHDLYTVVDQDGKRLGSYRYMEEALRDAYEVTKEQNENVNIVRYGRVLFTARPGVRFNPPGGFSISRPKYERY